jgi:two-component sensor histidine kinase
MARSALDDWDLSGHPGLVDTVSLLVTELVSNGVRHAQTQLTLTLTLNGSCLRIAVADGDPRPPVARARQELSVGGWGLALVESLSSEWGTDIDDNRGKTVWFEIDTAETAPSAGSRPLSLRD